MTRSIADMASPVTYIGSHILSSFLTPDIVVKVVAPVNWRARYDERRGKSSSADAFKNHELPPAGVRMTRGTTAAAPVIKPFIAKDLKGMTGSSAGMTRAPAISDTRVRARKGHPSNQAL